MMKWKWMDYGAETFIGYETEKRLSNGSTAWFGAEMFLADDGVTIQWNIEIEVYRKRRNRDLLSLELTGPGGTEAPGFFLEALSDFEARFPRPGDRIHVIGADGRRHRVYHRILGRRGYLPTRFDRSPILVKVVA